MYKWGKLHIPIKFVDLLKTKNHEKIKVEIISRNKKVKRNNMNIDLSLIDKTIIPRKNRNDGSHIGNIHSSRIAFQKITIL